ncbi:hypothetical protein [Streptomyces antimycoticus]|uniref:hypothetical protein n=1 Tax=Streptomyces antimycoticus TaxID=68175 RepID=UPI0036E47B5A
MIGFGIVGAVGTYTNIKTVFAQSATALGVVAAGEGATFVLALVYVGLTLLGQSSPAAVRVGLWILPATASGTGAIVARNSTEAVVFALTPMAMCVSAEGIGLLARRILIYLTGLDMETRRRNAKTMQRLAYHRARAANHPWAWVKKWSDLKSWRLARRVGEGDMSLGADLVSVQRNRMADGADAALADMFAPAATPALTASVTPALTGGPGRDGSGAVSVTDRPGRHTDDTTVPTGVTETGTQVSEEPHAEPSQSADAAADTVTHNGSETVTGDTPSHESVQPVTLKELAVVAGVPTPVPGQRLTDGQLNVVLRHLRYAKHPPLSYRQAGTAFRDAGYVGGEERVRKAWGALMSHEETGGTATETDKPVQDEEEAEEDEESEDADPRP